MSLRGGTLKDSEQNMRRGNKLKAPKNILTVFKPTFSSKVFYMFVSFLKT